ncbi:MAG: hypothetical protein JNJ57_15580 [Saprospiraceae bacterium]|nr:hypothetical protein [Saprospiraceae bacterium]
MNLDKFLVISGVPGVHKLITSRGDGVIIEDRNEGRTRFVSARQGQITPLATVAIYTYTDDGEGTVPLIDVFEKMFDNHESVPPVSPNGSSQELRAYFSAILPDHDRDRVHINDIKKCIKWYNFMYEKGILATAKQEAAAEKAAETPQETVEEPAEKPAKASKAEKAEKPAKATKKAK